MGPGLPEKIVRVFNQKNRPTHLVIRKSQNDRFSELGEAHLGYKAPHNNVQVDLQKYHGPRFSKGKKHKYNPHVTVWGAQRPGLCYYGIEGGFSPEQRDQELYHRHKLGERTRSFIGPYFVNLLKIFRHGIRRFVGSRVEQQIGLKVGSVMNGRWRVDHFRPI